MTKINTFIDIPTEIDLSEFVISSNDNKYSYVLYLVILEILEVVIIIV